MTAEPPANRRAASGGSAPNRRPAPTGAGRAPRSWGADRGPVAARWRELLLGAGWLVLIWNLLWGRFTLGTLLGGLVVALVVLLAFPLPPVAFRGRVRPVGFLRLVVRFLVELVTASVQVAWTAMRPGYLPRGAIIAVQLTVRTDLNLALTAELVSLVPGTLILEVDRAAGVLYVHVFDVRTPEDLTRSRRRVRDVERLLVRALGPVDRGREESSAT